jgi:hypothetical protein
MRLNFELRAYKADALLPVPHLQPIFEGAVSQTICLDWPEIMILLISARITGMSYWQPAKIVTFY